MDAQLIIEIRDSNGYLRECRHLIGDKYVLGRSHVNDFVVDDPYVCPVHCQILRNADGFYTIVDLGSVNGVYLEGEQAEQKEIKLAHNVKILVGKTHLTFIDPSVPLSVSPKLLRYSRKRGRATLGMLLSILGMSLVLIGSFFLEVPEEQETVVKGVAVSLAFVLTLCALWSAFWGLLGRIVHGHASFRRHFMVSCWTLVFLTAFSWCNQFVAFICVSPSIEKIGNYLGYGVTLLMLLYLNIEIATSLSKKARLIWSIAVPVSLCTAAFLLELAGRKDYSSDIPIWANLKPVSFALSDPHSVEDMDVTIDKLALEVKLGN